jgi:hypothetical protein
MQLIWIYKCGIWSSYFNISNNFLKSYELNYVYGLKLSFISQILKRTLKMLTKNVFCDFILGGVHGVDYSKIKKTCILSIPTKATFQFINPLKNLMGSKQCRSDYVGFEYTSSSRNFLFIPSYFFSPSYFFFL